MRVVAPSENTALAALTCDDMAMTDTSCSLCQGRSFDAEMHREQVWEDDLWRLTTSTGPGEPNPGFSYLEPKRHIPFITELDGEEARTLGTVLSRCTAALKEATGAELVYVYVFGGGIPHLHLHLAPHTTGDALNDSVIKGEVEEYPLESGATMVVSKDYPDVPSERLRAIAGRTRELLYADVSR